MRDSQQEQSADIRESGPAADVADDAGLIRGDSGEGGLATKFLPKSTLDRIHAALRRRRTDLHDQSTALAREFRAMANAVTCNCPVPAYGSEARSRASWVYIVHAERTNLTKIGMTSDRAAEQRMADLQAGSPDLLRLIAIARGRTDLESYWHWLFRDARRHAEWFDGDIIVPAFAGCMTAAPGVCARCGLR